MLCGGGFTLDNLSSLLLRQLESSEKVLRCFGYMIYSNETLERAR